MPSVHLIDKFARRALAAALAFLVAAVPVLADASQSSLWEERRRGSSRATGSSAAPQLASAALPGADVGRLLQQLPRPQSAGLSPSVANNLRRLKDEPAKRRLTDLVRALPAQAGTVRDITDAKAGAADRVVIHVQDVHRNLEAQENIAAAVKSLVESGAAVVALEGAFEPIKLAGFRAFPDRTAMARVSKAMLAEHRISGPVSVGMTSDKAAAFVGVDSKAHYDANVAAYKKASLAREAYKKRASDLARALGEKKRAVYPAELQRFDAAVDSHDQGRTPLGAYVRLLARHAPELPLSVQSFLEAYAMEQQLDFGRVERERSALLAALVAKLTPAEVERLLSESVGYRMGRVGHSAFYGTLKDLVNAHGLRLSNYPSMDGYVRYVLLTDAINARDLYRDIDATRAAAYRAQAATPEIAALVAADDRLDLATKLLDFSLTPEEWARYDAAAKTDLAAIGDLTDFENFYREAEARNDALAANVLAAMEREKAAVGILVTGGFHAPGISDRFAKAGVATMGFVPRLTKVDFDGSAYLSVFNQEKTPLDALFEGPKLFLAQHPASTAQLNRAAMLDVTAAVERQSVPFADLQPWFKNETGFDMERVEAVEDGLFRVTYARPAAGTTTMLVRSRPDGGFTVETEPEGALERLAVNARAAADGALRPLRDGLARAARAIADAAGSAAQTGPSLGLQFRIAAFNSTFVLAPIVTAAVVGILTVFGTVPLWIILTVYATAKALLFVSVVAHEAGHLWFDGQFAGLGLRGRVAASLAALNRKNLFVAFLVGTDITNAYVVATPREAVESTAAVSRELARTSRTAIAGPLANVALVFVGVLAWVLAVAMLVYGIRGTPALIPILFGTTLGVANLVLLLANAIWGSDFKTYRTGVAAGGIFAALNPLRPDDLAQGRAVGPVIMGRDTVIQVWLTKDNITPIEIIVANTPDGVVVRPQGAAARMANKESVMLRPGQTVYIGAQSGTTIQLNQTGARSISRFHVAVEMDMRGQVTVRDLFSRNGGRFAIRNPTRRFQVSDAGIDESFVEQHTSFESQSMTLNSLADFGRVDPDLIDDDALRRRLKPEQLGTQFDRIEDFSDNRVDRTDLTEAQTAELAFLRGYLPILYVKSRDEEQSEAWREKSAFLLETLINEAFVLSSPRGRGASLEPAPLPASVELTGGLTAGPLARVSDTLVTHWLTPDDEGTPLRVAVNSSADGRPLSLAIQRNRGGATNIDVPGDNRIRLGRATDVSISFQRTVPVAGRQAPLRILTVNARFEDGTARIWTATLEPDAERINFLEGRTPIAPEPEPAPRPVRVVELTTTDAIDEIERQIESLGGIALVFNRADLDAGGRANAHPLREREAKLALRQGRLQAVRRQGQAYLVWTGAAPAGQTIAVNPEVSMASDSSSVSLSQKSVRDDAMSIVSETVMRIRDRYSESVAEIAAEPVPNSARQLEFVQTLLTRLAIGSMRSAERAAVAQGLVRLFNMRVTAHRIDGRLFVVEDQGSGETIMGVSLRDFVGDSFESDRPDFESRADLFMALYEAWQERYGFREEYGEGYREKRNRAAARFAALVPAEFGRLVEVGSAKAEMILAAAEIMRRLPLQAFAASSNLIYRLRGGIHLAAPRDQAARIGHYRDEIGQLGIQPTVFQFRDFLETYLHEFGHVVQEEHIKPGSSLVALFAAVKGAKTYRLPALGLNAETRRGYIQSDSEMFAETFMHYVLHGELFEQGFPGYTTDPAAWRKVYAYYRDVVFQGVEYKKGQPNRPIGGRPFRIAALNSTFVLAPIVTAAAFGLVSLLMPVSLAVVPLLYVAAKLVLLASVVIHEMFHLGSDGQLAGKSFGAQIRMGFNALNRSNLLVAFLAGTDITNAFVVASPREAAVTTDDAAREMARTSRTAIAGPLGNLLLLVIGGSIAINGLLLALLGVGDLGQAALLLGAALSLANGMLLAINAVMGTDFQTWRTGVANEGLFRAFGRVGQSGPFKDGDFGDGKVVKGVTFQKDKTAGWIKLPGPGNVLIKLSRTSAGLRVQTMADARARAADGKTEVTLQPGQRALIGSGPQADVRVANADKRVISRYHILVDVDDAGKVTIRDLFTVNSSKIQIDEPLGSYVTEQGAPDEEEARRETSAAARSMADVSIANFNLADAILAAQGKAPLPPAVLGRQEARANGLANRQPLGGLSGAQERRLLFLRAYVPILFEKSRNTPEGAGAEEAATWARETAKYLEILLNEAEGLSTDAAADFTARPLPAAVRLTTPDMAPEPLARRSGDIVTHWLAPRDATNPLRVAVNTGLSGQLATLSIERKTGERDYLPVGGESSIPLIGAVDVAVEFLGTRRFVGQGAPITVNSLSVSVRYADGSTRRFSTILNPANGEFNLEERAAQAAPEAPPVAAPPVAQAPAAPEFPGGVILRGLRPPAPVAEPEAPAAVAPVQLPPRVGAVTRRSHERDDKEARGETEKIANEDQALVVENLADGIVGAAALDGIGGHAAGDFASRLAKDMLTTAMRGIRPGMNEAALIAYMNGEMKKISAEILRQARLDMNKAGMGTTAAVLLLVPQADGTQRALIFGSADARAYLQTVAGLRMLTVDNIQEAREMDEAALRARLAEGQQERLGEIEKKEDLDESKGEDIGWRLQGYVWNYLGNDKGYQPVVTKLTVPLGSRIVLVTDGVHDHLTTKEMQAALVGDAPTAAARLVEASYRRSIDKTHFRAKKYGDDATAVVVEVRAPAALPANAADAVPAALPAVDLIYVRTAGAYDGPTRFNGAVRFDVGGFGVTIRPDGRGGFEMLPADAAAQAAIKVTEPIPLSETESTIGRSGANTLVVPGELTSRVHLRVQIVNGQVIVKDGSTNGSTPVGNPVLTLRLTRWLASQFGLDPYGRFTEEWFAPIVEGATLVHFLPFFPLLHKNKGFVQLLGMAAIYGLAYLGLVAFTGGSFVDLSTAFNLLASNTDARWGAVLGGIVGHLIYNRVARRLGWATLTLGGRVDAPQNLPARLGADLVDSAVAYARARKAGDVNALLPGALALGLGELTEQNGFPSRAPTAADRAALLDAVRTGVNGRLAAGDVTFVEAQTAAAALSRWMGEEVTVGGRQMAVVARGSADEAAKVADLLAKYPDQRDILLVTDAGALAVLRQNPAVAAGLDSGRLRPLSPAGALFADGNQVRPDALEAALTASLDRAAMDNLLLVASTEVSFELLARPGASVALRELRYKALEELLANVLPRIQAMPLGAIVDTARLIAVQA